MIPDSLSPLANRSYDIRSVILDLANYFPHPSEGNISGMNIKPKLVFLSFIFLIALVSCRAAGGTPTTTAASISPARVTQLYPPTTSPTASPALVTPPPQEASIISQTLNSPDGQWIAEASFEFLEDGAGFRVRLVVRSSDKSVEWIPVDYTQDGVGYIYPAIRYWSPDSRTFYYFNMPTPDGCGDFYPVEDKWVVLDVADGSLSSLPLPPGRGHTISPDGGTMIYATSVSPFELRFRDTLSGTERSLPLPPSSDPEQEVQAGGWVWSPDGSSNALSITYGDSCGDPTELSFSVLRIDNLTNPTLVPLIEGNSKLIRLVDWATPDRILVKDWNGYSWWMDSRDGQEAPAP